MAKDDVDRWLRELRKGSSQLAILQLVREADRYGYEIVKELDERTEGALSLAEGNVYPALHALEERGHITSYWESGEPGVPPRKYYAITAQGRDLHARLVAAWRVHADAMDALLGED